MVPKEEPNKVKDLGINIRELELPGINGTTTYPKESMVQVDIGKTPLLFLEENFSEKEGQGSLDFAHFRGPETMRSSSQPNFLPNNWNRFRKKGTFRLIP